jgi:hypothetical protein
VAAQLVASQEGLSSMELNSSELLRMPIVARVFILTTRPLLLLINFTGSYITCFARIFSTFFDVFDYGGLVYVRRGYID